MQHNVLETRSAFVEPSSTESETSFSSPPADGRSSIKSGGLILLWLGLAGAFTAAVVNYSLLRGKLCVYPFYDDVIYFEQALLLLFHYYEGGIAGFFHSYISAPPHSPFSSLMALAAYAICGPRDWAPYAANGLIIFAVLVFLDSFAGRLPAFQKVLLGLFILTVPVMAQAVDAYRPDIASGACAAAGAVLLVRTPPSITSRRRRVLAGALIGAAALFKPPTFPLIIAMACLALCAATAQDVFLLKKKLSSSLSPRALGGMHHPRGVDSSAALPADLAVLRPLHQERSVRRIARALGPPRHLDLAPPLLSGRRRRRADARAAFLSAHWRLRCWACLCRLETRPPHALSTLRHGMSHAVCLPGADDAGEQAGVLWLGVLLRADSDGGGCAGITLPPERPSWNWSCCIAADRRRHLLQAAAAPLRQWKPASRRRRKLVENVYLALRAEGVKPTSIVYVTSSGYFNRSVLSFFGLKQDLFPLQVLEQPVSDDLAVHTGEIGKADFVVASERGNSEAMEGFLRSGSVQNQTLDLVTHNPEFELAATFPTANSKSYYLFRRSTPFAGVDPIEGLTELQGPFPQWGLHAVRWGTGPRTRLRIVAASDGVYRLLASWQTNLSGQQVTIQIDGRPLRQLALSELRLPQTIELRFDLKRGVHEVELDYSLWEKRDPSEPFAVLFRSLKIDQPSDPARRR